MTICSDLFSDVSGYSLNLSDVFTAKGLRQEPMLKKVQNKTLDVGSIVILVCHHLQLQGDQT